MWNLARLNINTFLIRYIMYLSIYFVIIIYGKFQPYSNTILCEERVFSQVTKLIQFNVSIVQVCTRLFGSPGGSPTVIGKRSNLNGECCQNDLCNNNRPFGKRQIFPDITTTRPRTTTPVTTETATPPPIMTTVMTSSACMHL